MKSALWLFLYLILHADRKTGCLFRRVFTIVRDMGVPERTVYSWLHRLKNCSYIQTKATGRSLRIEICKWKSLNRSAAGRSKPNTLDLSCKTLQTSPAKSCRAGLGESGEFSANFSENSAQNPANKKSKLNILKNGTDKPTKNHKEEKENRDSSIKWKSFTLTERRKLAEEISISLKDQKNLSFYLGLCLQYPEKPIRKALSQACSNLPNHPQNIRYLFRDLVIKNK